LVAAAMLLKFFGVSAFVGMEEERRGEGNARLSFRHRYGS
jgi:hypothetical protein